MCWYSSQQSFLEQHIRLHATDRGETLVDRHKGLDSYLLETPVNEVYAMGLLRQVGIADHMECWLLGHLLEVTGY